MTLENIPLLAPSMQFGIIKIFPFPANTIKLRIKLNILRFNSICPFINRYK